MKRSIPYVALAVIGVGCGDKDDKQEPFPPTQEIQQRLTLQPFASCEELEGYIEDTAVLAMKVGLERQKSDTYWGGDIAVGAPSRGDSAPEPAAAPSAGAESASGPGSHTTTNTQVAGVDEADFVKNDGTRIFTLSAGQLHIARSWPAAELGIVSSTAIEGWPTEMFLDDKNRLVVFSRVYTESLEEKASGSAAPEPSVVTDAMYYPYAYGNTVKVTVLDVADIANPRVSSEVYLPGSYTNSRRIGAAVRLVLEDRFRMPAEVRHYLSPEPGENDERFWERVQKDDDFRIERIDALIAKNEALIRAGTLDRWFPAPWRKKADGSVLKLDYDCTTFSRANAPTPLGLVTLATLNLDAPETPPTRASIVTDGGEIYASTRSLYIAARHWWWQQTPGQVDWTYLHKFDLSQPGNAVHVASGGVEGTVLDQFSLDEDANGFLRAATTLSRRVVDGDEPSNPWGRIETSNRVSVLAEKDGRLEVVGRTDDLAKGERITSARFLGNKGYVVTFRQVDPLYTLDLRDPTAPKVVGELKIPGFSSYIHPLGDNHLLTIGTYVPEEQVPGQFVRSIKLAIFDVTDPAQPKEAFTQLVGDVSSHSEAQSNHKAFNFYAEKKLLAIPFTDYGWSSDSSYWSGFRSELRVYGVDAQTGFTERGALSMRDLFVTESSPHWTYSYSPSVRRSVMADDFVYAISDAGIRAANISSLSTPVATAVFPRTAPATGGSK